MAETDQLASQMRKTGLTKAYFSTLLLSPIAYYAIMTKNITIKKCDNKNVCKRLCDKKICENTNVRKKLFEKTTITKLCEKHNYKK